MAALSQLIYRFHDAADPAAAVVLEKNRPESRTRSSGNENEENADTRDEDTRDEDDDNDDNTPNTTTTNLCDAWNRGTFRPPLPPPMRVPNDLQCHWYYHSPQEGTQVMIVSTIHGDTDTDDEDDDNNGNDNNNNNKTSKTDNSNNNNNNKSSSSSMMMGPYVAVVFAGTDDYQTSLLDIDIWRTEYGDHGNWTLPDNNKEKDDDNNKENVRYGRSTGQGTSRFLEDKIWVHAGFNGAVFAHGLQNDILTRLEAARRNLTAAVSSSSTTTLPQVYVTGHSLGAAASLLSGIGLALYYSSSGHQYHDDNDDDYHNNNNNNNNNNLQPNEGRKLRGDNNNNVGSRTTTTDATTTEVVVVKVINFGCPAVGNRAWRDYIHSAPQLDNLAIWRFVLGWDIVPRLPSTMLHIGHTVQMEGDDGKENGTNVSMATGSRNARETPEEETMGVEDRPQRRWLQNNKNDNTTFAGTMGVYYNHYGDKKRSYASVPWGWSSTPYIWVPGAIASHNISRYWRFLYRHEQNNATWLHEFVPTEGPDDYDNTYTVVDDDDDNIFWHSAAE